METYQPDHYRLLGVSARADAGELKNSYRRLSRIFHPDRQHGSDRAAECFKQIATAYAELSDPNRRSQYDRLLLLKDPLRMVDDPRAERALDVLDNVVARLRKKPLAIPGAQRGRDLRVHHSVAFAKAMLGGEVHVRAEYETACAACAGQGTSEPARNPTCHVCLGHGSLRVGLRRQEAGCGFCKGRGAVLLAPCKPCHGKGIVSTSHEVMVTLPPRCHDGLHVRIRGAGEKAVLGSEAGDLVVVVAVQGHPLLRAERDDLVCQVPLTWSQALRGARVRVPTLEGVEWLTIPQETPAGREFRILNRGLPMAGHPDRRGALRLQVVVDVPHGLGAAQLEAVRALEQLLGSAVFARCAEYGHVIEQLHAASEAPLPAPGAAQATAAPGPVAKP